MIRRALVLISLLMASATHADVRLGAPFGDHMVLQCDQTLSIWGSADPDERVSVQVDTQSQATTADATGRWSVKFAPLHASAKAIVFSVKGKNAIEVADVLVGEVWFCAGQSNMEFALGGAKGGAQAAQASLPNLRLFRFGSKTRGLPGVYTAAQRANLTPEKFSTGTWAACEPARAKAFSAVAFFFGAKLQDQLNVPVGLIEVSSGGTPAEAWIAREALANHPKLAPMVQHNWLGNDILDEWCRQRGAENLRELPTGPTTLPADDMGPNHPFKPGFMWSASVQPLLPLNVRGVLWYQGESNALNARRVVQHRDLFPLLVKSWREKFAQNDLPFLYVQLPGLGTEKGYHSEAWPLFRDDQRRFLQTIPHTGMAITIDVGDPANVHPANKQPVGQRLAQWALGSVYGQKIPLSGPRYRSYEVKGDRLVITFDDGAGLKTSDNQSVNNIELSGSDGVYHPAVATIDHDRLIVQSKEVSQPVAARYAWSPFPRPTANLCNSDALPASPFTTEVHPKDVQ